MNDRMNAIEGENLSCISLNLIIYININYGFG